MWLSLEERLHQSTERNALSSGSPFGAWRMEIIASLLLLLYCSHRKDLLRGRLMDDIYRLYPRLRGIDHVLHSLHCIRRSALLRKPFRDDLSPNSIFCHLQGAHGACIGDVEWRSETRDQRIPINFLLKSLFLASLHIAL
jgi:hypothetical protein